MSLAALGGWVEMETHDIGTSIYNEMPLTDDKRALKIKSLDSAVALDDRGMAKMLAMSREGLLNSSFRKILCKFLPASRLNHIRSNTLA